MKKLLTLFLVLAASVVMMNAAETIEIDFRTDPLTLSSGTATLVDGYYHDNTHGYYSPVISAALLAGNYKITVGNCTHSNTAGSVKNADGTATLDLIDANGQTYNATGVRVR